MSLIDVDYAFKHLRGKCVAKYPSTFLCGLLAAADEIAQIPTIDVPTWIPVAERLPELGEDVLVILNNSEPRMVVFRLFCDINGLYFWEDEIGDGLVLKAVTHWMPLPDAPKDGDT